MYVKFYKNGVKSVRPVLVIDKGRNVSISFHAEVLQNLILKNLLIVKPKSKSKSKSKVISKRSGLRLTLLL